MDSEINLLKSPSLTHPVRAAAIDLRVWLTLHIVDHDDEEDVCQFDVVHLKADLRSMCVKARDAEILSDL